jgi:hypothetical protein
MTDVVPEVEPAPPVDGAAEARKQLEAQRKRSERALDHLAEIWVEMANTDAWEQLQIELGRQAEKAKSLVTGAMFDRDDPVNQRDIDHARGVIEGLSRPMQIINTARDRLIARDTPAPQPEPEERGAWS